MREKMRNKKGFTLAELLIVVAIIAILVAIMIPVFGKSRAEAILARDTANLRAIYAEAVTNQMSASAGASLEVDLGDALIKSGVNFDKDTKATYTPAETGSDNPTIVVSNSTGESDPIIIDKDVTIKAKKVGGSGSEELSGTSNIEIVLPFETTP